MFKVPAETLLAACEAAATATEAKGRPGLSCVCFEDEKIRATNAYVLFESKVLNTPDRLLLNAQEIKALKPKGICTFEVCDDLSVNVSFGNTTGKLQSREYAFPRNLATMFGKQGFGIELCSWKARSDIMERAFKIVKKLGSKQTVSFNFDGIQKPCVIKTDTARILVMHSK